MKKSILVLALVLFAILVFLNMNVLGGENYYPPPPDKSKTLPANDGGPDGCKSSRFKCVMGGEAVLDKQTGITWARNVNVAKKMVPWQEAVNFCQDLEIGNRKGWRLPTKEELITILDTSTGNPALPEGHPFKSAASHAKWSSANSVWTATTYESNSKSAYWVSINLGRVGDEIKILDFQIWPVLGGK